MLNGHVRGGQNPVKNRGKESLVQAFLPPKEFILQLSHSGLPGSSRSVEAVLVRDGDSGCVLHLPRPNYLQRRGFFNSFESFDAAALATKKARDGDSRCVMQLLRPNSITALLLLRQFRKLR